MGQVITFASGGKGGVGKSVLAVNLAGALAHKGYSVAIVDTDTGLKDQESSGTQSVVTWGRIRDNLIESGEDLPPVTTYMFSPEDRIHTQLKDLAKSNDFVVLDTPGSTTTALRSAVAVTDVMYLPINCTRDEFLPLPPIFELVKSVEDMLHSAGIEKNIDLRILPTRVPSTWRLDTEEFYHWYQQAAEDIASISSIKVPFVSALSKTVSYGICLHDEQNKYRAIFDLLIEEILGNKRLKHERVSQ